MGRLEEDVVTVIHKMKKKSCRRRGIRAILPTQPSQRACSTDAF